MMNLHANQMLRMISEDAGAPELRNPELGKLKSERKRASRADARNREYPTPLAWMAVQMHRM